MFKELIKARQRWYGKNGDYPTAVKITRKTGDELASIGKVIKIGPAEGFRPGYSINGMRIYIDDEQKDTFVFGYAHPTGFSEAPF